MRSIHLICILLLGFSGLASADPARCIVRALRDSLLVETVDRENAKTLEIAIPFSDGSSEAGRIRFEVTDYGGKDAVVLYRIVSEKELIEFRNTGKWKTQDSWPYKSFSFFWEGSISDLFYKKQLRGSSYGKALKVYLEPSAIRNLFQREELKAYRNGQAWKVIPSGASESTQMSPDVGIDLIHNVNRLSGTSPDSFLIVDEIAFPDDRMDDLSRATLGVEIFTPESH
jgi:hypothetical protein